MRGRMTPQISGNVGATLAVALKTIVCIPTLERGNEMEIVMINFYLYPSLRCMMRYMTTSLSLSDMVYNIR